MNYLNKWFKNPNYVGFLTLFELIFNAGKSEFELNRYFKLSKF